MNKKILYSIAGVVAILAVVAAFLLMGGEDPAEKKFRELRDKTPAVREIDESVLAGIQFEDLGEGAMARIGELSFEQIVALLRQKYGAKLDVAYVRVQMLEELIAFLKNKYPDDWVARLQEILFAAFPERAAALFSLSENLYEYQKQMDADQSKLAGLSGEERREYLKEMRRGIFGDEADEIFVAANRAESVTTSLAEIASAKNTSVAAKIESFRESIEKAYGNEAPRMLANHRQEYTNAFFTAVQSDLAAMKPEERRATYRTVWQELGYDTDTIERLDTLETTRDQRWSNGEIYMAERKAILSEYSGTEREAKLDELRKRLFAEEADSIQAEEESGFFRYEKQRTFGRE